MKSSTNLGTFISKNSLRLNHWHFVSVANLCFWKYSDLNNSSEYKFKAIITFPQIVSFIEKFICCSWYHLYRFTEDGSFQSRNSGENDHYQNRLRTGSLFPEIPTKNQHGNFIEFVWQMGGGPTELPIQNQTSFIGQMLGNSKNDTWNYLIKGVNTRHSQCYKTSCYIRLWAFTTLFLQRTHLKLFLGVTVIYITLLCWMTKLIKNLYWRFTGKMLRFINNFIKYNTNINLHYINKCNNKFILASQIVNKLNVINFAAVFVN